ncbi:MAG TPA: protein kinase [Gaiellaceae bacterium]|jgi:serine/threonine-protein kinase
MAVRDGVLPDRYVGPESIGRGGMGQIYRATDTSLGRDVAIKVLDDRYAQDHLLRARFTREALAAARLSGNPNIVTIYDVGEHHERPYIVMEYLGGGSLEEQLRDGAVAPRRALEWLEQAGNALDAAHREGVIHRDVKPANLLLDRRDHVHVADFGIASAAGMDSLTQTGTVLGTASYLSPEQAQGERTTAASDLYSLGVVAFELLTGRRPFEGDSIAAEAAAHVTGDVPSVGDVNPNVPRELDPVFAKALAKDPAQRYTSAAEFVAALRASLEQAAGVTRIVGPPTAPTRLIPRERPRRSLLVPALLGLLLAAGVGLAFALTRGSTPKPQPVRVTTAVRTVTAQGSTQTVVSTLVTTAPPSTTTTSPSAAVGGDPVAENNNAYELMKQGRFSDALPLLQDAQQQLDGQGNLAEAYTDYNLGYTLIQLGQCADAMPYLERSKELQHGRHEVEDAIKQARKC